MWNVQDICDKTVADAEVLPVDPPRDDWLVHKVCFHYILMLCLCIATEDC